MSGRQEKRRRREVAKVRAELMRMLDRRGEELTRILEERRPS